MLGGDTSALIISNLSVRDETMADPSYIRNAHLTAHLEAPSFIADLGDEHAYALRLESPSVTAHRRNFYRSVGDRRAQLLDDELFAEQGRAQLAALSGVFVMPTDRRKKPAAPASMLIDSTVFRNRSLQRMEGPKPLSGASSVSAKNSAGKSTKGKRKRVSIENSITGNVVNDDDVPIAKKPGYRGGTIARRRAIVAARRALRR